MSVSSIAADVAAQMKLDPKRFQQAPDLARGWCEADAIPSLGLVMGRADRMSPAILFGRQTAEPDAPPIREDAIFLIASITKPIVAMGAMLLVERGELLLNDRVSEIIPEFAQSHKIAITIRHLLTHTSGLPDMLPNNRQLRAAHAPLSDVRGRHLRGADGLPGGAGGAVSKHGFRRVGRDHRANHRQPLRGIFAAGIFRALEHGRHRTRCAGRLDRLAPRKSGTASRGFVCPTIRSGRIGIGTAAIGGSSEHRGAAY